MRKIYLLDTNIISEFGKNNPNPAVVRKVNEYRGMCAICSIVWQELIYGLELMPEGRRKEYVENLISSVKELYDIISYDSLASQICGELSAKCEKIGKTVPHYDSQIAATAIANNMILVTHNTKDFESIAENSMLQMEDWWE